MKDVFKFLFLVITGRFRNAFEILRQLKIGTQIAFLGLGVGSYAVHQYPKEIWLVTERAYYAATLAAGQKSEGIPLSKAGQQQLAALIATLQNDQIVELRRRNLGLSAGYNSWAVAQMSVGLGSASPFKAEELKEYFDSTLDPTCPCWRETPQAQAHTGATGWIMFSQAKLGIPTEPRILSFLLSMQSPDGWWALYPAKPDPVNASTYATAWAALALCSQLPIQQSAPGVDLAKIRFAVENAMNWLSRNEIADGARWMDYPVNTPSMRSASITGLVIHVMHQCNSREGVESVRRRWLDNLPFEVATANDTEMSNTNLYLLNNGLEFDRTRHYVMQWTLIGIVDAYATGNLQQRAAALQWIERILKPGLISPEVRNQRWVAAELHYALRYLQSHVAGTAAKGTSS